MRGIGEVLFPDLLMAGLTDIGIGVLGASRLQEPARSLRRGWISGPPRQATTNQEPKRGRNRGGSRDSSRLLYRGGTGRPGKLISKYKHSNPKTRSLTTGFGTSGGKSITLLIPTFDERRSTRPQVTNQLLCD